mgnify:CR=1 FL=1
MISIGINAAVRETILATVLAGLASSSAFSQSQDQPVPLYSPPVAAPEAGISTTSPFLMEPDAQLKGDRIKDETFNSQPAGQNQNWNLDIGRFQPKINDDPNRVAPDLEGDYSGLRLRLPLRGGLRQ